jgi:hypothetical protein
LAKSIVPSLSLRPRHGTPLDIFRVEADAAPSLYRMDKQYIRGFAAATSDQINDEIIGGLRQLASKFKRWVLVQGVD